MRDGGSDPLTRAGGLGSFDSSLGVKYKTSKPVELPYKLLHVDADGITAYVGKQWQTRMGRRGEGSCFIARLPYSLGRGIRRRRRRRRRAEEEQEKMVAQPNGKKSKAEHEGVAAAEQQAVDEELLAKLEEVQGELEKLDEEASNEVLEVERKYNGIRQPIYDRRNKIIETIPDFWLTAFLSHPTLSDLIADEDREIFKHLQSLEVHDLEDAKIGYSIAFNFHSNPYFENSRLTKTLSVDKEGKTNFTGTDIKWKDGRGTSTGMTNDKGGNKRPFSENSFFTWFSEEPTVDFLEVMSDEVASIIQEELWPNPLKYFTGEISEVDEDDDDMHEDGENDENATEDSEDDDEDV